MSLERTLAKRIADLEDDLHALREENRSLKSMLTAPTPDGMTLTPEQKRIYSALARRTWVSTDRLASANSTGSLRAQISWLRNRIRPHGLTIVSDWNGSYRMMTVDEAAAYQNTIRALSRRIAPQRI